MFSKSLPLFSIALFCAVMAAPPLLGQQIEQIWSPRYDSHMTGQSQGDCYFRKKFTLVRPSEAELILAAADTYEVYINGEKAAEGQSYGEVIKMDVTSYVKGGVNLIAVHVGHRDSQYPGLALRFRIKEKGEARWRSLSTDTSWKTRSHASEFWFNGGYNDLGWLPAQVIVTKSAPTKNAVATTTPSDSEKASASPDVGPSANSSETARTEKIVGSGVGPSANPVKQPVQQQTQRSISNPYVTQDTSATAQPKSTTAQKTVPVMQASEYRKSLQGPSSASAKPNVEQERFKVGKDFVVQQVLSETETGSLLAMAFNEFGQMVLSKERGPLLLADARRQMEDPMRVRVLCSEVNSCQGIVPLNGELFVTGMGPDGMAVYRLADPERTGTLKIVQTLLKFKGKPGEHGPHGLELGPDGMLYIMIGNASGIQSDAAKTSPYRIERSIEGDLVPRYEDPGGHAVGVKAPGGTIVRMKLDGSNVETVCGGIRNAYDLVFNRNGDLFFHDSDMEADMGMAWYRPTQLYHVPHGAEFGWRSGWSKFPEYFEDTIPSVAKTDRGSPTGAVLYQHFQYPQRYHNKMFMADWSEGRILVMHDERKKSGYTIQPEVFLTGKPANIVDVQVGEDGSVYFCTGGRGTSGGVFRVVWKGTIPKELWSYRNDLERVIRHPQPTSAWARQNIALLKNRIGDRWNSAIKGVATEPRNQSLFRLRALDTMVFYGPFPDSQLLGQLASEPDPLLRAKVAELCGIKSNEENLRTLGQLITDTDAIVQRRACESYLRLGQHPSLEILVKLLESDDRNLTMVARRVLEQIPVDQWNFVVLKTESIRLFIQGTLSLMTVEPSLKNSYAVLARCSTIMNDFVSDSDFVDLLRVVQVALVTGNVQREKIPGFIEQIATEFPADDGVINRQLAMIMARLKAGDLEGRIAEYLTSEAVSPEDKLFVSMYLQTIGSDLNDSARMAIINQLEIARVRIGGGSYREYLVRAVDNLSKSLTDAQVATVIKNGDRWPNAMISAFYRLPEKLDEETLQNVIAADRNLKPLSHNDLAARRMRLGTIAILARSGDDAAMDYLRQIWLSRESSRNDISIGLAQQPQGKNWAYLVSSIPILDDQTGKDVLTALSNVNRRPSQPKQFRDVIELGLRMREQGADTASLLLEHWTGLKPDSETKTPLTWTDKMAYWKNWYQQQWPSEEIVSIDGTKFGKYTSKQVLEFLEGGTHKVDMMKGERVFAAAKCAACHRVGMNGEGVGPDLTNLAKRFSRREILESIVHPSKIVSDQFQSKKLLTVDGVTLVGMITRDADGSYIVLDADAKKTRVKVDEVEEMADNELSAMPTGLLDKLSMEEIGDLFGYLYKTDSNQRSAQSSSNGVR